MISMTDKARLAAAICLCCLCSGAQAQELNGVLSMRLREALPVEQQSQETSRKHDLVIDAACTNGKWEETVWAHTPYIPGLEHLGKIEKTESKAGQTELRVRLEVNPNKLNPPFLGGTADYLLRISVDGEKVTGEFSGETRAQTDPKRIEGILEAWGRERSGDAVLGAEKVQGRIAGTLGPIRRQFQGFSPPRPSEHPRLLFRKGDLPAIRKRVETAEGKKLFDQVKGLIESDRVPYPQSTGPLRAAAHGFLYQMTGEQKHLDMARYWCLSTLYTSHHGTPMQSYSLLGLSLAYDMCYEGLGKADRQVLYAFFEQNVRQLSQRHDQQDVLGTAVRFAFPNSQENFHFTPWDRYQTAERMGAAMAALAILDDTPEVPPPPALTAVLELPPADDYDPWPGVPMAPFESETMARDWLLNGPFLRESVEQIAEGMGGWKNIRPEPGDAVEVEGVRLEWRQYLPTSHRGFSPRLFQKEANRNIGSVTGGGYPPGDKLSQRWAKRFGSKWFPMNVIMYTVIRNDAERVVEALPNWRGASAGVRMWLSGREVRDGELLRIRPGLYPLLVEVPLLGLHSSQSPKLRDFSRRNLEADVASRGDIGALCGATPETNRIRQDFLSLRRCVERYISEAVDPQGWGIQQHEFLLPFLLACRNATGANLCEGTGLERQIPICARLLGHRWDDRLGFILCHTYPLIGEEYRAPAKWYMDRRGMGVVKPLDAAVALVTVPPEAPSEAPQLGTLPLAEHYEKHGILAFNSGFDPAKDFLAVFAAGREPCASRFSAGAFTLHGMGRSWGEWRMPGTPEDRILNSVVIDGLYPWSSGEVVWCDLKPDGSGSATAVVGKLVDGGLRTYTDSDGQTKVTAWLGGKPIQGTSLLRAFAVDYSGKSGAPVLVATADSIQCNKFGIEKSWRMDLGDTGGPIARGGRQPTVRLRVGQRDFKVSAPDSDANLLVTFVQPRKFDFRVAQYGEPARAGTILDACVDRNTTLTEQATGAMSFRMIGEDSEEVVEDSGRKSDKKLVESEMARDVYVPTPAIFFVIMTVQKGTPPAVEVVTEGEKPTVRVGKRTIQFDGKKLTLGE